MFVFSLADVTGGQLAKAKRAFGIYVEVSLGLLKDVSGGRRVHSLWPHKLLAHPKPEAVFFIWKGRNILKKPALLLKVFTRLHLVKVFTKKNNVVWVFSKRIFW